jgi:hypothetical protein
MRYRARSPPVRSFSFPSLLVFSIFAESDSSFIKNRPAHTCSLQVHTQIIKQLQKQSELCSSQFALLLVDAHGNSHSYGSDAFQENLGRWLPEEVRKEASQISVDAAMKREMHGHPHHSDYDKDHHQSPNHHGSNGVDIDGNVQDEDDGNEGDTDGGQWDAECDEDNHDGSCIHQQSTPRDESDSLCSPKAMRANGDSTMLLPPPPADQRRNVRANGINRKRSIQPDSQITPPKKRRSTVKRNVRRADSSSGESNDVVLEEKVEYKGLDITNEEEVNTFFETRLRQMQQLVCKVVAKCWIKVIEPKKQSNFPYNRGEESKPSWWPPNARHKEPDHLMKPGKKFAPSGSISRDGTC